MSAGIPTPSFLFESVVVVVVALFFAFSVCFSLHFF